MNCRATWIPDVQLKLSDERPPITPRAHQIQAWDRLVKHFFDQDNQAGLLVLPTGGGKTVVASHFHLEHHIRNGGRLLWLAHRRSLLRQAFRTFWKLGNVAYPKSHLNLIAISSDDAKWSMVCPEHDVVFASMQTAVLENNRDFVEILVDDSEEGLFVVVDEAQHAPAPGYARLLRRLKERGCKLLGLTATPVRMNEEDQRRLAALFDENIVYQKTRGELTEQNILAAPSFETVKTRIEPEGDFTPDDYRHLERFGEIGPAVLQRLAENAPRNKLIVDQYVKNRDRYGPTIVFAADVLHCQTLAQEFQKAGAKCGFTADYVAYDRKDAQTIINRYQENRGPDVLINVEMLTEGFDAPHTRSVFVARPTRSEGLLSQMVGRALRGTRSNGNEIAYLVTFLDTWEQFQVVDAEYVLGEAEDTVVEGRVDGSTGRVAIPPELVRYAYELLVSKVKGHFEGVFQCLPYGWYAWEEEFENDLQRRTVMVFDNQRDGFQTMLADHSDPRSVPGDVSQDYSQKKIREYFADAPDPLPRWGDIQALLDAKRKGCEIRQYTFEEKREFDPSGLAQRVVDDEMGPRRKRQFLQEIWDRLPGCRFVYRDDFHAFLQDVSREEDTIVSPPSPPLDPEVEKLVPREKPRAWGQDEVAYSLVAIRDVVLKTKKHFPNGSPTVGNLRWSERPAKRLWGFCRYADRSITINRLLNSPDVPLWLFPIQRERQQIYLGL